jgi:predicted TPR repeat methyltransferase
VSPPTASDDSAAFERARASFLAGLACHRDGRFADAVAHYLASLADVPGRTSTLTNLAAARLQLGHAALALDDARAALQADADNRDAMRHEATALAELGRTDEALDAFGRFVTLEPDVAPAWLSIGNLLMEKGKFAEADEAFERALELGADAEMTLFMRAAASAGQAGPPGKTAQPTAPHTVDAEAPSPRVAARPIGPSTPPPAPPRAYVETLFDRYAADFDHHLVDQLGYDAPRRLVDGLPPSDEGAPRRFARALDLGCGTGLCAPPLRPRVAYLVGVDLSAAMLDRARALGMYDRLEHDDIARWLGAREGAERFDLVVAADVFIYVGALDAVFAGVARVLDADGVFAFTIESPDGEPSPAMAGSRNDFLLRPTMRYAHSAAYVAGLAHRHGMRVVSQHAATIRRDRAGPVGATFVYLRRRA